MIFEPIVLFYFTKLSEKCQSNQLSLLLLSPSKQKSYPLSRPTGELLYCYSWETKQGCITVAVYTSLNKYYIRFQRRECQELRFNQNSYRHFLESNLISFIYFFSIHEIFQPWIQTLIFYFTLFIRFQPLNHPRFCFPYCHLYTYPQYLSQNLPGISQLLAFFISLDEIDFCELLESSSFNYLAHILCHSFC